MPYILLTRASQSNGDFPSLKDGQWYRAIYLQKLELCPINRLGSALRNEFKGDHMSRSSLSLRSKFLSVLSHLQSLHPHENEITLKFTDRNAMETFKLAAMNSLIAETRHQSANSRNYRKNDGFRRQNLEDELYQQPTSRRAAILCRNPLYWRYLEDLLSIVIDESVDEMRAREYINAVCAIVHRRELDFNPVAKELFHQQIENPFLVWLSNL